MNKLEAVFYSFDFNLLWKYSDCILDIFKEYCLWSKSGISKVIFYLLRNLGYGLKENWTFPFRFWIVGLLEMLLRGTSWLVFLVNSAKFSRVIFFGTHQDNCFWSSVFWFCQQTHWTFKLFGVSISDRFRNGKWKGEWVLVCLKFSFQMRNL